MIALLVLCGLATARITRLVRDDTILDRPRGWLFERLTRVDHGVRKWLYELLRCPWCISAWLAAGAVAVADWFASVPLPGLFWAATWWVACFGYWIIELVAESHDEIWQQRARRKFGP